MTVFLYLAATFFCLLPAGIAFNYIRAYGVNVAVVDDFIFVEGLSHYLEGNSPIPFFLGLHNGHCLLFGKLMMVALGFVTHFNIIAEMYLSWVLIALTFLLLLYLAFKTLGTRPGTLMLMVPVSVTLFGLRPWDVFLNGSVFLNSMTIFFTILSLTLLELAADGNKLSKTLIASITCGVVGSLSGSISGMLVWPIGMLQRIRLPVSKMLQSTKCRLWVAGMIGCAILYVLLIKFGANVGVEVKGGVLLETLLLKLSVMPQSLLALLGFPFCPLLDKVQLCGLAVLSIYIALISIFFLMHPTRKHAAAGRAATSIFLFGLCAIALITFGRSGGGTLETTATRYVQFSEILLVGAYMTACFSSFENKYLRPVILSLLAGMAFVLYVVGYLASSDHGSFWRNLQLKNAYLLRTYKIQANDELAALQSNPFFLKRQAGTLEKMKLNVFSRPRVELDMVPTIPGEPSFCFDRINTVGSPKLPQSIVVNRDSNQGIKVSGWAFDKLSMRPAKRIALIVDDGLPGGMPLVIPACSGLFYPGVDQTFHSTKLQACGFFASFSPDLLSPGSHSVCLAVETTDGASLQKSRPVLLITAK